MSNASDDRLTKLMTAARQSPEFGVRLLAQLTPVARAEAVRCWTSEALLGAAAAKPGLRKCAPGPAPMKTHESAQLAAFARTDEMSN